jgi:hypothetical protein
LVALLSVFSILGKVVFVSRILLLFSFFAVVTSTYFVLDLQTTEKESFKQKQNFKEDEMLAKFHGVDCLVVCEDGSKWIKRNGKMIKVK